MSEMMLAFSLMLAAVSLVLTIRIFARYAQTRVTPLIPLGSVILIIFLSSLVAFFLEISQNSFTIFMLARLSVILPVFTVISLTLFFQSFEENVLLTKKTFLWMVISIILISLAIWTPFEKEWRELLFWVASENVFYLTFSFTYLIALIRILSRARVREQTTLIKKMIAGFSVGFLTPTLIDIINFFVLSKDDDVEIVSALLIVVGQIYLAIIYLKASKNIGLLQIPKVWKIIFVSHGGLCMFHKSLDEELGQGIDAQLIAGSLFGMWNLMKQITKKDFNLKEIILARYHILLRQYENFMVILIAESSTHFAISSMRAAGDKFADVYGDKIEDWLGDEGVFEGTSVLVDRGFGKR